MAYPNTFKLKLALATLLIGNLCSAQSTISDTSKIDTAGRKLDEVTVKANRNLVKQEIDKLSYDVQNDPERRTLNASDMMRKVPMLSIEADGSIRLRGSSNYRILINGKESGMMVANPKEVLRNMPASAIKSIEIITTPSSKFDAEGPAGFINIVLSGRSSQGYNANLRINHEMPAGGPNFGGNLTLSSGKVAVSINGSLGTGRTPQTKEFTRRDNFGALPEVLINNAYKRNNTFSVFGGAELSYAMDSLNLMTAEYSPYSGYNKVMNHRAFEISGGSASATKYIMNADNKYNWGGKTIALNFQHGFLKNPKQVFTLSYRLVSNDNPQINQVMVSEIQHSDLISFRQNSVSGYREHIFQGDLVLPLKTLIMEAGLKMILRYNNSKIALENYDPIRETYELNESVSGNFSNQSKVYGAYNSYHYQFRKFGIKAGYRLEYSTIAGEFRNGAVLNRRDYLNLIPSLSLMQQVNSQSSVALGYTNRIERPRIYQLDPFPDRSVPNFLSSGNPALKPALAHQIEFNYRTSGKLTLNSNLSYAFSNDVIQQLSRYDAQEQVTLTTYENNGSDRQLKLYLDLSANPTSNLSISVNGLISKAWFEGTIESKLIKTSGLNGRAGLNATQKLSKIWNLSGSLNYAGREISLQQHTNRQVYSSLRLYGDLVKNKLSVSIAAQTPFMKYRYYNRTTRGTDFEENYRGQAFARGFGFSLNWQLGSLSDGVRKNKRGISVDDGKP